MSDATPSVLRRMIRRARPGGAVDSRSDALRIEIARLADDLLGLDAVVVGTTLSSVERGDIVIGDRDLIFQMAHETLPAGLVTLSPELLATLIEVQIAGRVAATAPPERVPTRTDAVVAAPLLDAWIEAISTGDAAQDALRGFRRASMIAGPKAAQLALDSGCFTVLAMRLSLGGGAREGQLVFHLPEQASAVAAAGKGDLTFLTVDLDVILCRERRPLGRVRALRPGDVIEIDPDALGHVSVEYAGRKLASARLGRVDETRAIRIAGPAASIGPKGAFVRDGGPDAPEVARVPAKKDAAPGGSGGLPSPPASTAEREPEVEDLADLPPLDALPPLDDLPPLGDLPDLDGLPPLGDLPPLAEPDQV